ncbi:MAG: peptide chain release factor N(5)-glutamine methyltransferase [Alphaproteobacteria bacterium]|nr:peptide chain release factor N(5)-glutamine methyltransferase [Alphaproteobacteria bacterium]
MSRRLADVLAEARAALRDAGVESADTDARLLAEHAFGMTREEMTACPEKTLEENECNSLKKIIKRRASHEPVSRIIGYRWFWKSKFKISKETLDPRPDSETLIEAAIKHAGQPQRLLDLGTGSGCLLLSLLQEWPSCLGTGIDISPDAVNTAAENARLLGLAECAVFQAVGWADFVPEAPFDCIISNPPYIAVGEKGGLEPEVADYDPPAALYAGNDGLEAYRAIISLLPCFLTPSGYVFFEIGHRQAEQVSYLLGQGGYRVLETIPDLAGNDRCIVAQRAG